MEPEGPHRPLEPAATASISSTVAFGPRERALAATLPAGMRCGPYLLAELLGSGGYGAVSRGVHESSGEEVALKTVRRVSQGALLGIRREIQALARLRHPGIVRILATGVAEGIPWYAMELVQGASLRAWVPAATASDAPTLAGVAPAAERIGLVARLCEPLAYLHGERIVHRDLKPDNVIVRPDGTPVIVDFGLAESLASGSSRAALEVSDGIAGTIAYMAPEQIRGRSLDARADLYSLGCILYELLTGTPPFVSEEAAHLAWLHLHGAPTPPSRRGAPPELDDLILQLLQKAPAARMGYAGDVARALVPSSPATPASGAARPYLYRAPLVERDVAIEALDRELDAVASGGGAVVLLQGGSGTGKTRLLSELASRAFDRSFTVLAGECAVDEAGKGALRGLRRPLEDLVDRCLEAGEGETRRILGVAGRVLAVHAPRLLSLPSVDAEPPLVGLGEEQEALRLWRALGSTFDSLAARKPLVLIVDDLQLADDLTRGFVDHWMRTAPHAGVLLAVSRRDGETQGAATALARDPSVRRLTLGKLTEQGVGTLVREMLALEAPPAELVMFLARESEGNPFAASEYLLAAVDRGLLGRDAAGRWCASGGSWDLPLPASVQTIHAERLADLAPATRAFLDLAAASGRSLLVPLLEAAAAALSLDAMAEVDRLVASRFLEVDGGLRFASEHLRELACRSLTPERTSALHRVLAEAAERDELAALVGPARRAHFWELAGDPLRARPLQLAGAHAALAQHDRDAAEHLFRAYLRGVGAPSPESFDARLTLAISVLKRRGRRSEAQLEAETLLREAEAAGDVRFQVLARKAIAQLLLDVRPQDAVPHLEEAVGRARELGDAALLAGTLITQGDAADITGRPIEALAIYDEAGALAEAAGAEDTLAGAIGNRATLLSGMGRFDEAWRAGLEALEIRRRTGDRQNEMLVLGNLAGIALELGRFDEAVERLEATLRLAREIGDRRVEGLLLGNLGVARHQLGDVAGCRHDLEGAIAIHRETENRKSEAYCVGNLATLLASSGELAAARGQFESCLAIRASLADVRGEALALGALSALERYEGRLAEAADLAARAFETLEGLGDLFETVRVLAELGHVELARGGDVAPILAQAEERVSRIGGAGDDLASRCLERLRRAAAARAAGETLVAGMARSDAPGWLVARS